MTPCCGVPGVRRSVRSLACALLLPGVFACLPASGQPSAEPVQMEVNAAVDAGALPRIWNYFGYDEPNYTYSSNGRKLLRELAALSPAPVYVRTHNLLTSGNGQGSLKWGSTNAYTEDANGKPVYSWTVVDRIFDAYREARVRPLVEIGFMPEALSVHPQPYRHNFPNGPVFTGWSYPPKDYGKWAKLVYAFAAHLRRRYGDAAVSTWLWEVWNEPDIDYWHGTPEEYDRLYDYSADAVLRAVPGAKIGGPESTGPANEKAAQFLRQFLEHCGRGRNAATGRTGAPLAFVSFHPKGNPSMVDNHVRMGMAAQLNAIDRGFKIVASFPEWRSAPIILGENDPEGCAACSAEGHPQNAYRNGPLFPTYTAVVIDAIYALAKRDNVNFRGAVTWSFQFDDQPYFAGLRELATNGIDKPVLNAFRMYGMLSGRRVGLNSSVRRRWQPCSAEAYGKSLTSAASRHEGRERSTFCCGTTMMMIFRLHPRQWSWQSQECDPGRARCEWSSTGSTTAIAIPSPHGRRWALRSTRTRTNTDGWKRQGGCNGWGRGRPWK